MTTFTIMGVSRPIFKGFKTRKAAQAWLDMLQAKPDGAARQFALKFTIKEVRS